jgi:hypothetical protein
VNYDPDAEAAVKAVMQKLVECVTKQSGPDCEKCAAWVLAKAWLEEHAEVELEEES